MVGRSDGGAAVVEFVLVTVPLLALLLSVVQVAVYLHVRNVVVAAAAEGARHGANADRPSGSAGPYARDVLARGLSERTADRMSCTAAEQPGAGGTVLVVVRCSGAVPSLLPFLGALLPIDVAAHALKEEA